ncbi:hypothetical protein B6S09_17990, partial [Oceanimonas baumannii]
MFEPACAEQVAAEYKARARECHPDKRPDSAEAAARFERLQTAKVR